MANAVQAIRGMNDILPENSTAWQFAEDTIRAVVESYGFREIRMPIVEKTELFKRSIGEVTDIVEKEMYTFDDDGDSLTLRPEATASMVRAGITHGLFHNQKQKLWTVGPMFRRERPQAGRYRQFHQFDVEAMGYEGPDIDAELILASARIWRRLALDDLRLELNSLGTVASRHDYRALLVGYFRDHESALDEDSRRRLEQNPMRILDSKNPQMRDLLQALAACLRHLYPSALRPILDALLSPHHRPTLSHHLLTPSTKVL